MPDLLLELFSEEIPSRFQRKAAGDLRTAVTNALVDGGLTYEGVKEYWTPRRLVLDIRGLTARSADIREERKGPRTDAPEKAIEGFMRGAGIASIEDAEIRNDPKKGDFYVAVIEKPGREASEIISEVMPGIIKGFPWPKSMRWGEASAQAGALKWVRPLQSILCLFGPETEEMEVVPFEVDGIRSGNETRGHRFMAPDTFVVKHFDDYASKLQKAYVMLDADMRKDTITAEAKNLAFAKGLELVEDEKLLDEVSGLVEWPTVLMGEFGEEFLDIPAEVIQLTIRENQKCFVLRKSGTETLTNNFLLVSNIIPSDGGKEVARGNAKVVNARLSDAKFFWESDLRQIKSDEGFEPWIEKLNHVTFHAKLGSQGERVQRVVALAEELAPVVGANPELAKQAATLCKADLNSAMVYEFPEVQGKMGRTYAERKELDSSVALAIQEHYSPLGPSDNVPSDPVSVTVALADKLDTLVGFWAIDEKPTSSKDPYALRRAALGVIRLVLENGVRLVLRNVALDSLLRIWVDREFEEIEEQIEAAQHLEDAGHIVGLDKKIIDKVTSEEADNNFQEANAALAWNLLTDLLSFFHDRLKVYLRDKGIRHDLIDAVLSFPSVAAQAGDQEARRNDVPEGIKESASAGARTDASADALAERKNDDLLIIARKSEALQKLIDSEDGQNLLAGYKRAANILAAEEKKSTRIADAVSDELLTLDVEKALNSAINAASADAEKAIAEEDFESAMSALATLRAPVDTFFEDVLVNDEDEKIRANRLALLARIRTATATVADFSKISG